MLSITSLKNTFQTSTSQILTKHLNSIIKTNRNIYICLLLNYLKKEMFNMEIKKSAFYILSSVLSTLLIALIVFAYGGSDPTVHGHSSGEVELPTGLIIAFDASSCPSGWTQVAAGKVIVGLDSGDTDFDNPGDTGGAKTVTLSISQIPSHSHNAYYLYQKDQYDGGSKTSYHSYNSGSSYATSSTGGGAAHENMPPYVAYIYCKKN